MPLSQDSKPSKATNVEMSVSKAPAAAQKTFSYGNFSIANIPTFSGYTAGPVSVKKIKNEEVVHSVSNNTETKNEEEILKKHFVEEVKNEVDAIYSNVAETDSRVFSEPTKIFDSNISNSPFMTKEVNTSSSAFFVKENISEDNNSVEDIKDFNQPKFVESPYPILKVLDGGVKYSNNIVADERKKTPEEELEDIAKQINNRLLKRN